MSKNNSHEYVQRMQNQRQRFALRKLTVGVASVLLGAAMIGGGRSSLR